MRFKMQRQDYIPKNAARVDTPVDVDVEIWVYEIVGKPCAIAFNGKQNKPAWHYRFPTEERQESTIRLHIQSRRNHNEAMAKRRQERVESRHTLAIGDILYASWGYDQTNIDFYQVVKVTAKSVYVREIAQETVGNNGHGTDNVAAIADKFCGEPMLRRASADNYIKIKSYISACPWDGKPKYQTAFGFGH